MIITEPAHYSTESKLKAPLSTCLLRALDQSDTPTLLKLLNEHKVVLLDPIDGPDIFCQILYVAIKKCNPAAVQYLLNLPVIFDIAFFEYCGHTPISLVVEEGNNVLLPFLLNKTDHNFSLHMAVKLGLQKTIQFLLQHCTFKPRFLRYLGL